MNLFSLAQQFFFALVDMARKVYDFLQEPLLGPEGIKFLEDSEDLFIIGDILDSVMDLFKISNWGEITMFWAFTAGIVTVISVLFIKWILDWVL